MNKHLQQAKISFPQYWNEELVIEKLQTLRDEELYEFFGCSNKQSFARKMNPYFPRKDSKTSFFKAIKDALDTPIKEDSMISRLKNKKLEQGFSVADDKGGWIPGN